MPKSGSTRFQKPRLRAVRTYPIVALMALAGLREREAMALRVKDIDFVSRTIHITRTPIHSPKNDTSDRIIPLCDEAWKALMEAVDNATYTDPDTVCVTVQPRKKDGPWQKEDFQFLFKARTGNTWTGPSLSKCLTMQVRNAAGKPGELWSFRPDHPKVLNTDGLDVPRLGEIPIHRLRSSFITMVDQPEQKIEQRYDDRLIKAYVGHSAGDTMGKHYRKIRPEELRPIVEMMNGWRRLAGQEKWTKSGLVVELAE